MDKPTDEEIRKTLEILRRLEKVNGWFLTHEIRSIQNVINSLESILHYSR